MIQVCIQFIKDKLQKARCKKTDSGKSILPPKPSYFNVSFKLQ